MKLKQSFKETEIGMIPEDWEIDSLKNHLIIRGRIGWKGLMISEYTNEGPYIVGGLQIIDDSVDWENCAHITEQRYYESPEIMLRENDILMTKDGTIGKLAYIKNLPDNATVASHIHVIRKKTEKVFAKFLFYVFKTPIIKALVDSKISGSVVPALTQRDIETLNVPLPSIPEQTRIAQFFSSLDDKIEVNRQMNKTLEKIGQTLFKHWFIDFEFPNEKGEDLYYRINVFPIVIPPLGGRKEDIPLLIDHFISKFNIENNKNVKGISKEALELMMQYKWPGNIRELGSMIERMIALTSNDYIQANEIPFSLKNIPKIEGLKESVFNGKVSFLQAEEEFEREIILDALKRTNYIQSHAAELLGISRRILKYKMDRLGIVEKQ
jgi:restriction endonuclease S subunit